ncbi:MAG: hypothetical protein JRN37_06520 [Nitrososphaerota archaeon]|jgi:hypothetical protein|nr:hypothetical protein [Nitrososphaerota archaeon]MDG7038790.1 hypothetical protein [Nitrososphaerota archaeon]
MKDDMPILPITGVKRIYHNLKSFNLSPRSLEIMYIHDNQLIEKLFDKDVLDKYDMQQLASLVISKKAIELIFNELDRATGE